MGDWMLQKEGQVQTMENKDDCKANVVALALVEEPIYHRWNLCNIWKDK